MAEKSTNKKYTRSSDYRKQYLDKHKGFFGVYCCSYCGKLCSKSQMEVDHIYPVDGAASKTSGKLWVTLNTWYLPSNNKGVNEPWNTTSACHDCNSSKSNKGGAWVWRGYLGRIIFPIINLWLLGGLSYSVIMSVLNDNDTQLKTYVVLNIVFRIISYIIRKELIKLPNKFPFTNKKKWR